MWEDLTSQGQLRDPGEGLGAQAVEAAHGCFLESLKVIVTRKKVPFHCGGTGSQTQMAAVEHNELSNMKYYATEFQ